LIPHEDSKLSDFTFVSFDVETTGLDPLADRIVEIGAVKFDHNGNLAEYQQFVNPKCPIPSDAVAIHGITDEMVSSSPLISTALPSVVDFFGDSVLIAHNAPFDIGFFDAAYAHAGMELPNNEIFCTLQLARAVFPGLPGYGLEALAGELRLAPGQHHRALADAAYTADVFRRCIERAGAAWDMSFSNLQQYHGAPFLFGKARDSDLAGRILALIEQAIEEGTSVRIDYRSSTGKATTRTISPRSIDDRGAHSKVIAFCHLRDERRTFRLDCIKKIEQVP
jgi:DNA polymerase III epsilon subunit family exonuclease